MGDVFTILRDNWMLLLIGQYPTGPLGGLAITVLLSLLGLLLAFPLSVCIAVARTSPFAWLRRSAMALIYVVRGVPLVMFIFWVYFFVPLLIGRTVGGFTTMVVTLVIYQAAYLAALPKYLQKHPQIVGLIYFSGHTSSPEDWRLTTGLPAYSALLASAPPKDK